METHMIPIALLLFLSLLTPSALGGSVICEKLPQNLCSLSVSSTGKRCVLERYKKSGESTAEYCCKTSEVEVVGVLDWIETDQCVDACGVDRMSIGISSDSHIHFQFTTKLCSQACRQACPIVFHLYSSLAAVDGLSLPNLCEASWSTPIPLLELIQSSGSLSSVSEKVAPSPAPST